MNFLNRIKGFFKTSKSEKVIRILKRIWAYAWPPLLAILVLMLVFGILYGPGFKTIYREAVAGQKDLESAQKLIVAQEFVAGQDKLKTGKIHLENAQTRVRKMNSLKKLPWVKTQINAMDNLLAAGISTTSGINRLSAWAETVVKPFKVGKAFNLGALKPEQKSLILKAIYEAQPDLQAAKASVDLAITNIEQIPNTGVVSQIASKVKTFKELLPQLQEGIAMAIPASKVIPPLLGYPDQQNYLFLLQNNSELRPTGGFIGTYGILKIKDGEILSFTTDNVYNLDNKAKYLNITPPQPLIRYNRTSKWFFRDSNWSPDFPTSAQEALSFYRKENGPERKIDGVIAMDPEVFKNLLNLTGPITIGKTKFTSENLVDELQYLTGFAYVDNKTVDTTQRKGVIGQLGKIMIDKVIHLSKDKYSKAWVIFNNATEQKHLMLWAANTNRQLTLEQLKWTGSIKDPVGDNLMVVDANIASLKTDPAVKRTITYELKRQDDQLIANLTLKYENIGQLTWKTTRYRTYTRVYVPLGSKLISTEGEMYECNSKKAGQVDKFEELNHTGIGIFTCVEIGATKELKLKYQLSPKIYAQLEQGEYNLLIQKQPGTLASNLNININVGKNIKSLVKLEKNEKVSGKNFQAKTDLSVDRSYIFKLED
ncbi:MAG: DUF4012 domain-containing protein [Patescibacteria group bacterium]|jgi:hypothetical protein